MLQKEEQQSRKGVNYIVPQSTMKEILLCLIRPAVLRAIKRTRQRLPVSATATVHPALQEMVFGTTKSFTLSSIDEIEAVLGIGRKTFGRGSYAMLSAPLEVWYSVACQKLTLKVNYEVYSEAGVIQWPVFHDVEMEVGDYEAVDQMVRS